MTEQELISRCLEQDRTAQQELYRRYCDAMFSAAYRITGDHEEAADVLQEAFVKIFRRLDTFRKESTLGAWIKTIVVRTALSKVRRKKTTDELKPHHTDDRITRGEHLDAEYLEQAILSLPEGYRTVFLLIEVEGYSHKETAELLGISVGTSKSQLYYAKRKLREMVTKMGLNPK